MESVFYYERSVDLVGAQGIWWGLWLTELRLLGIIRASFVRSLLSESWAQRNVCTSTEALLLRQTRLRWLDAGLWGLGI